MKTKGKPISIRLSQNATKAWYFLQDHKVCPANYLRDGGENMLIDKAIKFGLKLRIKKVELPF